MDQIIHLAVIAILSFLLGSIPTAYLIVRRSQGKDLRNEGSGNIGTLNAYEVTRSRGVGVIVLVIDLLKGAIPILVIRLLFPEDFHGAATALVFVVLGHNYSPWIGWKGGRGLGPAAGASLAFNPLLFLVWCVLWAASYWKSRNVHFGNIAATVLSPFAALLADPVFTVTSLFPVPSRFSVGIVFFLLCTLIFIKHLEPLRQLIASYRTR
jgi:glycerol-3-phosphate acyltransferase PlsY